MHADLARVCPAENRPENSAPGRQTRGEQSPRGTGRLCHAERERKTRGVLLLIVRSDSGAAEMDTNTEEGCSSGLSLSKAKRNPGLFA